MSPLRPPRRGTAAASRARWRRALAIAGILVLVTGCGAGRVAPVSERGEGVSPLPTEPGGGAADGRLPRSEAAPGSAVLPPLPSRRGAEFQPLATGTGGGAPKEAPSTPPDPASRPGAGRAPAGTMGASASPAVIALVDAASSAQRAGRPANAAASLERALRIEPRNPLLWHELARVKLAEGDPLEAEQLAVKSNSLTQSATLRARNWHLIAGARRARGDPVGAQRAAAQAERD